MPIRRTIRFFLKAAYRSLLLIQTWNWSRIVLCIIISCFIWTFQALNKANYHTTIKFPILIKYERKDVMALEEPPQHISVQVTGNGWQLFQKTLGFGITPLQIEIEDPTQVKYFTPKSLMPNIVQQLNDIRVDFIAEDSVFLNYDSLATKQLALHVDSSTIPLAENYRLTSSVFLDPSFLTVSGPASLIAAEPDSFKIKLDENSLDENFDEMIDISYQPPRKVSFYPDGVQVKFDVDLYFKKRITVPIQPINFPEDSTVYLARQLAIIEYDLRRANEMQPIPDSLYVLADYALKSETDSMIIPQFSAPYFMENISILPKELSLIYQDKNNERRR